MCLAVSNARKSHDEKEEGDHLGSTEQLDVARGSYVNKVVHQFESGKVHGDAGMMGPPPDPTSSTTASSIPSKAPSLTVVGRSESLKSTHNRKSHLARGAGVRKKSDPAHLHRSTETNDNGETSSSGDLGLSSLSTKHPPPPPLTLDPFFINHFFLKTKSDISLIKESALGK